MHQFQLERGNSGYVFDWVDTNHREIIIQFKAESLVDMNTIPMMNSYIYPLFNANNEVVDSKNETPPEMWICSDTYWTWSRRDGVQYHKEGVPDGYQ